MLKYLFGFFLVSSCVFLAGFVINFFVCHKNWEEDELEDEIEGLNEITEASNPKEEQIIVSMPHLPLKAGIVVRAGDIIGWVDPNERSRCEHLMIKTSDQHTNSLH